MKKIIIAITLNLFLSSGLTAKGENTLYCNADVAARDLQISGIKWNGIAKPTDNIQNVNYNESLDILLQDEIIGLDNLDFLMQQFLQANKNNRQKIIYNLWFLAKKYRANELKFQYLIDNLMFEKPIEIIDEILHAYKKEVIIANKIRVIFLLSEMSLDNIVSSQDQKRINAYFSVRSFLEDIIENETHPDLIREALLHYPKFAPPEIAFDKLETQVSRHKGKNSLFFHQQELDLLRVSLLVNNEKTHRLLIETINNYQSIGGELEGDFACRLSNRIASMDNKYYTTLPKNNLINFIEDNYNKALKKNDSILEGMLCQWLTTLAQLQTSHANENPYHWIQAMLLAEKNIAIRAKMFSWLNPELIEQLEPDLVSILHSDFKKEIIVNNHQAFRKYLNNATLRINALLNQQVQD